MGVTLTDVLLFGKAQSDDVDNATLVIYRRNILRWSALGGYLDIIVKGVSPISLPDAIANSLEYLKAFGGTEQRNLPDGYIQRQFIYMMDGSYLLTDIVPTYDCKIEMDFQTTGLTPGGTASILGGRSNTNVGCGLSLRYANSIFAVDAFGLNSNDTYTSSVAPTANTRYKFTYDNQVATLESGGSTLFTNTMTGTQANGAALAINAMNSNGTTVIPGAGIYLYSFKAWNAQGELVMDLVPAIQKGTVPVVGFYDTVSGTFKTATAGTFAAGGEAVPTPDTPMDIVSNNGVLKVSKNLFNETWEQGAIGATTGKPYEESKTALSTRIRVVNEIYLDHTKTYTISINNPDLEFVIQVFNEQHLLYVIPDITNVWGAEPITFTGAYGVVIALRYKTQADILPTEGQNAKVQLEQGSTATPYVPYSPNGIYADGTVETINVHGKNLFDISTSTLGGLSSADGSETVSTARARTDFVGINTSKITVTIDANDNYGIVNSYYYDENKNYIDNLGPTAGTPKNGTFTVPNGSRYVRVAFCVYNSPTTGINIDTFKQSKIQIENGSTATTYENYFNGGTATAEMLLKVGDYEDVQEILSGAVTRNVGIKVLDGTEDWQLINTPYFSLAKSNITPSTLSGDNFNSICSHFARAQSGTELPTKVCFYWGNSYLNINIDVSGSTTLAQFKQYLADQYANGTPVVIIYPLATPTTESVAGQTLQVQGGDNAVEITQASLDNLEIEAKYQAVVSLTIQEVQDANLDPNVQVTIN